VSLLRGKAEVSEEMYESVAAVIWKSYQEQQGTKVQGTGIREQGTGVPG